MHTRPFKTTGPKKVTIITGARDPDDLNRMSEDMQRITIHNFIGIVRKQAKADWAQLLANEMVSVPWTDLAPEAKRETMRDRMNRILDSHPI